MEINKKDINKLSNCEIQDLIDDLEEELYNRIDRSNLNTEQ